MLFHHAPERTDQQIDDLLAQHRASQTAQGSKLVIHAAYEGMEFDVTSQGLGPVEPAPLVPVRATSNPPRRPVGAPISRPPGTLPPGKVEP
jgi:hypothetical protein